MNKKRVKIKYHNITSYAISHIGKVRSNHEDNFLLDNGQVIDIKTQKNIKIDKNIDSKQYIESSYKKRTNKEWQKYLFQIIEKLGQNYNLYIEYFKDYLNIEYPILVMKLKK